MVALTFPQEEMPLCQEASLAENNPWDQLFIEQVLQLTSPHSWTRLALIPGQIRCFMWALKVASRKQAFSHPLCQCWFLLSLCSPVFSALHVTVVVWELDFLAYVFWGLHHQRRCPPLAGCRGVMGALSAQRCHVGHQENTCTFFWAFSLPTGISKFLPCMFLGHHWLDLCSCTLDHAGWRIENCFGGWWWARVAF